MWEGVSADVAKFGLDECLRRRVNLCKCYWNIDNGRIRNFTAGKLQDKTGTSFVSRDQVDKRGIGDSGLDIFPATRKGERREPFDCTHFVDDRIEFRLGRAFVG